MVVTPFTESLLLFKQTLYAFWPQSNTRPDIEGSLDHIVSQNAAASGAGALSWGDNIEAQASVHPTSTPVNVFFKAGDSNALFGKSSTLQNNALRLLAIIKS